MVSSFMLHRAMKQAFLSKPEERSGIPIRTIKATQDEHNGLTLKLNRSGGRLDTFETTSTRQTLVFMPTPQRNTLLMLMYI